MANVQSMIFTIYGDYIHHYGNKIWTGSLIRLMKEFGYNEQSVRVAVSRMAKQGWLESEKQGNKSYYYLTPRGEARIKEAGKRIFKLKPDEWDGKWRMLMYTIPEENRHIRDELRKELLWSGFGSFSNGCWISPNDLAKEVRVLIEKYEIQSNVDLFLAEYMGLETNQKLVQKSWELDEVEEKYEAFIAEYSQKFIVHQSMIAKGQLTDADCFVERAYLVHEYRKFLFIDPGLPLELLPEVWKGNHAALLFEQHYKLLTQSASQFFEAVFKKDNDMGEKDKLYDADEHPFITT